MLVYGGWCWLMLVSQYLWAPFTWCFCLFSFNGCWFKVGWCWLMFVSEYLWAPITSWIFMVVGLWWLMLVNVGFWVFMSPIHIMNIYGCWFMLGWCWWMLVYTYLWAPFTSWIFLYVGLWWLMLVNVGFKVFVSPVHIMNIYWCCFSWLMLVNVGFSVFMNPIHIMNIYGCWFIVVDVG